ncbi:MAG: hypothetical protein HY611_01995 [Elusimicrobia bacterium]|nr:hypothetical protein [Elusimicrobiota bacterium]
MFIKRLLFSVFEFLLSVGMAGLVVYWTYRVQIWSNKDFDEEDELKKDNLAVSILLSGNMLASGLIIQKGLKPILSLLRIYMTTPIGQNLNQWQISFFALAQFVMVFMLAALTIYFSLRMFGKLTRHMHPGQELKKGNVSIGVLLASVVLVMALYISDGISSLSRAMLPQPSIGRVEILE